MFAADSVRGHDAMILGTPLWQRTAGAVYDALELDGTTLRSITEYQEWIGCAPHTTSRFGSCQNRR